MAYYSRRKKKPPVIIFKYFAVQILDYNFNIKPIEKNAEKTYCFFMIKIMENVTFGFRY